MKKLYAVLILELVILLTFEMHIGYRLINREWNNLITRIESDLPNKESKVVVWKDPAISDRDRENALKEYKEYLRLKKLGLAPPEETIDLGYIPGTYQYEMQKAKEEAEKKKEQMLTSLDELRKNHKTELGSVEDRFSDLGEDLEADAEDLRRLNYSDTLEDISYEVFNNDVYYIYTYFEGKDPDPSKLHSVNISDVEYEKDVIENMTGKRPDTLTIMYLKHDGEILYEITN